GPQGGIFLMKMPVIGWKNERMRVQRDKIPVAAFPCEGRLYQHEDLRVIAQEITAPGRKIRAGPGGVTGQDAGVLGMDLWQVPAGQPGDDQGGGDPNTAENDGVDRI